MTFCICGCGTLLTLRRKEWILWHTRHNNEAQRQGGNQLTFTQRGKVNMILISGKVLGQNIKHRIFENRCNKEATFPTHYSSVPLIDCKNAAHTTHFKPIQHLTNSHDNFGHSGKTCREFKDKLLESWWKVWALLVSRWCQPGKSSPTGNSKGLSLTWMKAADMMTQTWKDELKTLPAQFLRCWEVEQKLRSNWGDSRP